MNKRSIEDENTCSFYLERKKRPCRMKKLEGMTYCPHHSHLGSDKNLKRGARIPCPFDSSHFCYESRLQKHLKICNAREKEKPQYYVENINAGEKANSEEIKVSLSDVNDDELLSCIKKIRLLYKESNISILEGNNSLHPSLVSEMEKLDDGFNNFKHMKQQASILSLMESNGFLSDDSCFIEFGAGRGQLMYWIVQCVPDKEKCTFMLIDKSAQRHKSDSKFKGTNLQIERLRMDIQHLHLGKVDIIKPSVKKVVGVSKHLCGGATDLALRCLTNTLETENEGIKITHKALGFIMALCCHHRCTWSSYIGKDFMKNKGITERDFKIMCCIASWATCGRRKSDSKNKDGNSNTETVQEEILHKDVPIPDETLLNRYVGMDLKHEEREEIGVEAKRLIDAGRLDYLQQQGYEAKLVKYIDKSISLENVAIIGFHKESQLSHVWHINQSCLSTKNYGTKETIVKKSFLEGNSRC